MAILTTSFQQLGQVSIGTDSYGHPTYIRIYARYSDQEIANNRTYVYYQARVYHATSCYIMDGGGSGTVGGTGATTVTGACTSKVKGEVTIATTSGWVTHNDDGTKSVTATASLRFPNWGSSWNKTVSATATLPSIPRQANINTAPDFTDEQSPAITYTNSAGNSVTTLEACISFDGSNDDIPYRDISKTGNLYTFNLTDSERNILRNACATSNSRIVKFFIKTVIGGVTYYSSLSKTLTIVNANPILSPTVVDSNDAMVALTGNASTYLVRNHSDAQFIVGAAGVKGATIKSISVIGGGGSSTEMSGTISNVKNSSFEFTITDSRGNIVTETITKTLVPYVDLTCNLTAPNPDASGNLTLTISGNYYNDDIGATANTLTVQYRSRVKDGTWGDWTAVTTTKSGNTYSGTVSVTGLDYQATYEYLARAFDVIHEEGVESAPKVVKSVPVFDWGENDFSFNVPIVYLKHGIANTDAKFDTERQDTSRHVSFGVGEGGSNAGVFDYNANKWLVHSDSEGSFYFNQALVMHAVSDGNYWGLMNPDRGTGGWVRTTESGLLPYSADGGSSIGSAYWPFDSVHGNKVVVGNNEGLYAKNSAGTERSMAFINTSNDGAFGYGSYAASQGSNWYYGNGISIVSKTGINITSPTAGLSGRAYGVNKILCSCGAYMSSGQTISLSEAISAQPNGIILAWSWYNNDGPCNWDWNYFFIPKYHVAAHSGAGMDFMLSTIVSGGTYHYCVKYVYVTDTSVSGYSYNSSGYAANFVLRYVIGV